MFDDALMFDNFAFLIFFFYCEASLRERQRYSQKKYNHYALSLIHNSEIYKDVKAL